MDDAGHGDTVAPPRLGGGGFDPRTPLIRAATLTGQEGFINWEYHTAAVVSAWRVHKAPGAPWRLAATVTRADAWMLRQEGARLGFNAPRIGGYWHWPLLRVALAGAALTATLGPPEH